MATDGLPRMQVLTTAPSPHRILGASLAAIDACLLPQLRALLEDAAKQEATCRRSGKPWSEMLSRRATTLEASTARMHRVFERLHASNLGERALTTALLAQACTTFFMLLALPPLANHPLAAHTAFVPAACPFGSGVAATASGAGATTIGSGAGATTIGSGAGATTTGSGAGATTTGSGAGALPPLPPLTPDMLAVSSSSSSSSSSTSLPYLELYQTKMAFWGAYLLSQWGVARALSVAESSTMQREAEALRREYA